MRKSIGQIHLIIVFACIYNSGLSQSLPSHLDSQLALPAKYNDHINDFIEKSDKQLTKKATKYLSRFEKQENKIKGKLYKIDSLAANNLFAKSLGKYEAFEQKLISKSTKYQVTARTYLPFLDTLKTSLKFLKEKDEALASIKESAKKTKEILGGVNALEGKLHQAEDIKSFILERKQVMAQALMKYGLGKDLLKFQKEVYYYSKELQEYKVLLSNPDKIVEKSVSVISKMPFFTEFMQKNSDLAALFPAPFSSGNSNINSATRIPGLQTRMQTQSIIQNQLGSAGSTGQQIMQQSIQSARAQLDVLKNKINQAGGGGSDLEMPEGFKPQNQKTNPFWKRLEWGMNIQSTRANVYWPIKTDFGFSIGYKLNDKSIVGMGTSFNIGWGKDISHIMITSQGGSLRTFIDWKVKGGLYLSGGAEFNYLKEIESLSALKNYEAWQKSALIGLKKKYSLGKKWKGEIGLLYDILWQQHIPATQPVLFRLGYIF